MTEEHRQYELHKKFHGELAAVMRKYLDQRLARPLLLGALEDVKLVAFESYIEPIRKEERENPNT